MRLRPGMHSDWLADASWQCASSPAGLLSGPTADALADLDWLPAQVPGTAAGAVRASRGLPAALALDYDQQDWWFRVHFPATAGESADLELDGLATASEVWLNGVSVLSSVSMYARHRVGVELAADNELLLCCRALGPQLRDARPRARWRTRLVAAQGLRRWRTTLLGRMPSFAGTAAPVGPWRPVRVLPRQSARVLGRWAQAQVAGDGGDVRLRVDLESEQDLLGQRCLLQVGSVSTVVESIPTGPSTWLLVGTVRLPHVERWWPHTHGSQPLYPVSAQIGDQQLALGRVGFRDLDVDRGPDETEPGFTLRLDGHSVFCRGACWVPPDVVGLASGREAVEAELRQLRSAGLNMVRVTGTMTWESEDFWDCCDELGILVWQDCMLATLDPPDDEAALAVLAAEARDELTRVSGRPSVAVVSGGSETEQQPTMVGLEPQGRRIAAIHEVIPAVVAQVLPGVPYLASSPTGGALVTHVGAGVAHYFGVGAYLRPPVDARAAGVRFAAECLAFAAPPERAGVQEWFGSAAPAGHHPDWKAGVPRDNAASWDFEDVTQYYVRTVFGVDPLQVRYGDPERALDLSRAVLAHLMSTTMSEWRRPASSCAGALVLQSRDTAPGAGWGLLDAAGNPKSTWYALSRVLAAQALLVVDEGLDGLDLHLMNDTENTLDGELLLHLIDRRGRVAQSVRRPVTLAPRSAQRWSVDGLLDVFRDVNHAYRFGPAEYEAVHARLLPAAGADDCPLPASLDLVHVVDPAQLHPGADLDLRAVAVPDGDGWVLEVSAQRLARWVSLDVPGFLPADSWFHLAPGAVRRVALQRLATGGPGDGVPRGSVQALNGLDATPLSRADTRSADA